jgi:beta-lactamase class A
LVKGAQLHERRDRIRASRQGRHRDVDGAENFSAGFNALANLALGGAHVSAHVTDLRTGKTLVSIDDRIVLPTASIGKILLLIEVAARITEREFEGYGILDKTPGDAVSASGIWRQLQAPALPIADLAALVGASNDNLATNVLLRKVGLEAVRTRTESLGLHRTALLDLVRNRRGPDDAPQLSVGSTSELAGLMARLSRGEIIDHVTSQRVLGWLAHNADLSLVASAFGLDPLSHRTTDHGVQVVNKTGSDPGIRSEIGLLSGSRTGVAYGLTVQFVDETLDIRLRVIDAMRTFGYDLLEYVY